MNRFLKYIISQEKTMMVLLVFLLIAGGFAYWFMPKESNPDIDIPYIGVSVTLAGISPEDAERLLLKPLEKELKSISGVKSLTSYAREGSASVWLEFEAGFNADKALQAVKDKADLAKGQLPDRADAPLVREENISLEPVLTIGLSGNFPERTLLHLARELKDEIEGLPQVLNVSVDGDRKEVVEIVVNPEKLQTYHLTPFEVYRLIQENNKLVAAGTWDVGSGRYPFKVKGLIENWNELLKMPLKAVGDKIIILEDVANVRNTFEEPTSFARINGKPTIALLVQKRLGENVIETIEAIKEATMRITQEWPKGLNITFFQDRSQDIKGMLGDLQNSLLIAIILVMVVTMASLGIRSGTLIGVAIPGSFLMGILVLWTMGITINIVVLFSLILVSGMLVDGAIIVIEYADRKMAEGFSKKEAYVLASQQMAAPVISSTITTIAAFLPLLFWPDVTGQFMRFMPITMVATLSASIVMALIFVPILGMIFGKTIHADNAALTQISALEEGSLEKLSGFTGRYIRLLRKLIVRPGRVLLIALLFLIGVYSINAFFGKGVEYFPKVEPEQIAFRVKMRGDLSIWEMDRLLKEVEEKLLDMDELKMIYSSSYTSTDDDHGVIYAELIDWKKRRNADQIIEEIKQRAQNISGVVVEDRTQGAGPSGGKPIRIDVLSNHPELLSAEVKKISDHLKMMQDLRDVEDTRPISGIEWRVEVDRQEASKFGANVQLVGDVIQLVTKGLKISDYRPNDSEGEVEIRLRYPVEDRGLLAMEHLRIPTATGSIPIGNFMDYYPAQKVSKVKRTNGKRVMTIEAGVASDVLVADKVKEIQAWLATEANIDSRVKIEFKGEDKEQKEAQAFLSTAFLIALGLIAITLVAQFNSLYYPCLVLTGIIFSTVGVVLGLLITRQPFGIVMNGIGIIALAGIIVNNNIVLIDTFIKIRKTGIAVSEAILRTCAQRLRPVVLTVITATLGVLPMVLAINIDFIGREITYNAPSTQWWRQLSTSIAFGLMFGTVLTLVLTPCMLMFGENIKNWFKKKFSSKN